MKIKSFLENVRAPRKDIPLNRQITETAGIILFGFALGVLQKWLDGTTANAFSSDNTATGYPQLFWTLGNMDFIGNYNFCVCEISIESCY